MKGKIKTLFAISSISLIPTILVWLPFFLRIGSFWGIPLPKDGMAVVAANYDGPYYIVVAKTLYNPLLSGSFPFNLDSQYYAAHFPLYPILIKLFAGLIGFPYSMLCVTLVSSILAHWFFYKLITNYIGEKNALWVTAVFSILPARWLIVRSIGSPEPLFIAAIIASIYFFANKKYFMAGLWGAIAQATKSPGILLFIGYLITIGVPTLKKLATNTNKKDIILELKKYWGLLLIPLSLIIVFIIYKIRMHDFFAYFHSGDNIHLFFPPFQIFNFASPWVGTFWLEEIILVYLIGILGLIKLFRSKKDDLAWVTGVFFLSLIFVSHRDLIRYALPIVPMLLISYAKVIVSKDFKIIMLVLLIPIYLFSLVFISQNTVPISNWAPLL